MNSWRKRVDNGRQRLILNASLFPKRHRKTSGRNGDSCRKILWSDESGESSLAAEQKGSQLPKRQSMKTVNYIRLKYELSRLISPAFPSGRKSDPGKAS
jgi:hypothetical protein